MGPATPRAACQNMSPTTTRAGRQRQGSSLPTPGVQHGKLHVLRRCSMTLQNPKRLTSANTKKGSRPPTPRAGHQRQSSPLPAPGAQLRGRLHVLQCISMTFQDPQSLTSSNTKGPTTPSPRAGIQHQSFPSTTARAGRQRQSSILRALCTLTHKKKGPWLPRKVQHDPPGPPESLHPQYQGLNPTNFKSWAPTPGAASPCAQIENYMSCKVSA
jgi:hypothetical protein